MKKLKLCLPGYERISATALVYMLSVVCVCLANIFNFGTDTAVYCRFFIELLGLVIVCEIIDWLLFKLIHNWATFLIIEFIVITPVCLCTTIWLNWMECSWENIIRCAFTVLVVFISICLILTLRNRRDAEAITKQVQSDN